MTRPGRWAVPLIVLTCFAPTGWSQLAVDNRSPVVTEIRVEGLGGGPVDEASVLAFSSVKVGDPFTRSDVSRDVKALQKSGRFAFVGVSVEPSPGGVVLVYQVKNKSRLRRLKITGADYLSPSKIRKTVDLKAGDPVDDILLAEKTSEVLDIYKKKHFPYAKIDWVIDEVDDSGEAVVELLVEEGDRAKIGRISFDGNTTLSDKALAKVMKQRKANLLSWITRAGTYSPEEIEVDLYALRKMYLDKGYLDAQVGRPSVSPYGRNRIEITIPIDEGQQYRVGKYDITGVQLFKESDLDKVLLARRGDVASLSTIQGSAQALRDYYGSRGYMRTGIRQQLDADPQNQTVDITYELTEGSLARIRNINISGNERTKDKVIRRELAVYPGEVLDSVKTHRSEQRLRNLGYFSTVYSSPQETLSPDQYDLTFEVQEKKTGQFVVGAGFSSIDNLIGFVEVSQGNFDIGNWPHFTGGGQKLRLRLQLGTSRTDAEISFTEPWFLDRRLSLNVAFFRNEARFLSDDYDQRNTGGSVALGHALGGFNRIRLRYSLETIDVYDVSESASDTIKAEEGARVKSALGVELTHDSRNNFFIPSRGNRSTASFELAGGPLGGQTDTYTTEGRTSQFWNPWLAHVISVRGWVGVVEPYGDSESVPLFDRFFLGGARTLRGFDFRDVGPRDENGEAIGGNTVWFGSTEYTIPVVKMIRAATFFDIGMVYLDSFEFSLSDYNSDWGVGLRLDLPQFPLRLDYAWPIDTDEFNDTSSGQFNFLLGYTF